MHCVDPRRYKTGRNHRAGVEIRLNLHRCRDWARLAPVPKLRYRNSGWVWSAADDVAWDGFAACMARTNSPALVDPGDRRFLGVTICRAAQSRRSPSIPITGTN